jgi:protein-tyrosine phosphatase
VQILFVCLGNICRSPTVEAVARELAQREAAQLSLRFDSAGTAGYHTGDPPDSRSQAAARRRGYDLSDLRARQLDATDFSRFDLLLAMDEDNLQQMRAMAPVAAQSRLALFLSYAGNDRQASVPDPYYGGPADFDIVLDLAEQGSRALFVALAGRRGRS